MTIGEAISRIDELKHNTYTIREKLGWLSQLEARIRVELLDTHEGGPEDPFLPFTADTPMDTVLQLPEPYDEVYLRHLEAQMDYHSGEIEKFNNSSAMLAAAWDCARNYINRTRMPKKQNWKFI